MAILFVLIGLVLLVVGGEFLVRASVGFSLRMNVSRMVVGLTVVSFATSAPELIVSLKAALDGFSDISLGNVIGSNIANIGLVLAITTVISSLAIDRDFFRFNWPVMVLLSVVLYWMLWNDSVITRWDGVILVALLVIYIILLLRRAARQKQKYTDDSVQEYTKTSWIKITIWLAIGGFALWGGSELLVGGAVTIAENLGVSERLISITMISVGTSIPELAASVIAALKQEKAISMGNLIGSNIFNIASVLGITAIIQPIVMSSGQILSNDLLWMLAFAIVLLPLAFLPRRLEYGRLKGGLMLAGYFAFVYLAFAAG